MNEFKPWCPGDLVTYNVNSNFPTPGTYGWRTGPKLLEDQLANGVFLSRHDVGIVLWVWHAPIGVAVYAGSCWFYVLVSGKGYSWYPTGVLSRVMWC